MGKISLRVYGEEFIDFVQKNKNTFHQEDGKMRLIRRDKRWYLEDSKKEPLAFSDLNEDLSPRKATWKVKGDDSNQFIDTSIVIKIWGKKVVRAFGKSMKQEAPKVQPSTEPRTRNLKRSLRELDANSPVKRRKGNVTWRVSCSSKGNLAICHTQKVRENRFGPRHTPNLSTLKASSSTFGNFSEHITR